MGRWGCGGAAHMHVYMLNMIILIPNGCLHRGIPMMSYAHAFACTCACVYVHGGPPNQ